MKQSGEGQSTRSVGEGDEGRNSSKPITIDNRRRGRCKSRYCCTTA